jgi:hypothetical protein
VVRIRIEKADKDPGKNLSADADPDTELWRAK